MPRLADELISQQEKSVDQNVRKISEKFVLGKFKKKNATALS